MTTKITTTKTTASKTATNKTKVAMEKNTDIDKLKKENEELKEQMNKQSESFNEQLESIKQLLSQQQNIAPNVVVNNGNEYENIRPDKYIRVMSLTPTLLILSAGNGKFFNFQKFGNTQNIMYGDLVNIIHNHFKLATEGGFYIYDENAISLTGLKEYYSSIMTKDAIDMLFEEDADTIKQSLSNVSDLQKKSIAKYVIDEIVNGKDISTSKVDVIRELSGLDIMLAVDEMRNFEKEVAEIESR